jgi:ATP-dependent helicase/nuclease subunit A
MSDAPRAPHDKDVRDTVAGDLARTLFVEAGAGSGKTTVLVNRVCALVDAGIDIRKIAAITFTEKAAAELRLRVREELEARGTEAGDAARAVLGEAPMSTLHAFARRLLTEHGLAVGVPPRFDVLDEVGEAIYLEARWRELAGRLFDPKGPLAPVVRRAVELGLTPGRIRDIVFSLHQSYDRLRETPGRWQWPADTVDLPPVDMSSFLQPLSMLKTEGDAVLEEYIARAQKADTDETRIDVLRTEGVLPSKGAKASRDALKALLFDLRREAITALVPALAASVLDWADHRRRDGELLFHDLLALARDALRHDDVRAACHAAYERILIDEFQDTDPLQVEIAVLLASSRPDIASREWFDDPLTPADAGRLFFVGDPKQSIYRFRRADVELYRRAQDVFADPALHLTENFRTVASIVDFINTLFDSWMNDADAGAQPDYVALTPHVPDHETSPTVVTIGEELAELPTAEVRSREAEEVVRVIAQAKREGWMVRAGSDELRPARYSDIAVLMPTRATLPALDHGLDTAGIPARVESRMLIWNTAEVRDLLAVLSAIADPNDQVATVAALRSPGLACSDADLAAWRWHDGRWSYLAVEHAPDPTHPVAVAMTVLRDLHRERYWLSIGEMVRRVIDVCHLRELAFAHARPRDRWRRIDFFLAQARAFEAAGGSSIEEFVGWAREQAERDVWVNDAIAPDADDDAVRILTVHASKGLEFPIVVFMGLNSRYQAIGPPVLWGSDGPEVKAGAQNGARFETAGYGDLWNDEQAAFRAERVRLAYVAMTRARDRLVVSLFRPNPSLETLAREIAPRCPPVPKLEAPELPATGTDVEIEPLANPGGLDDRESWAAARAAALARLGRSPAVAATRVQHLVPTADEDAAPGDNAEEHDDDEPVLESSDEADDRGDEEPPWRRGRAGTAIGRAVHAVLQTADLATGAGVDDLAAAQAAAEGVPDLAGDIARRVRGVLDSPSVRAAVASDRYWREVFVAVPVGDRVLEGFIDLLYEGAAGELVVVDYKTDGVRAEADADEAVARYRLQAAAYAVAVRRSLGREVERCAFLFAGPTRCLERDLTDLESACAEVEALVSG